MDTREEKTSKDFEKDLDALKKIVDKLETDVSLDEGMKLFGEGLQLTEGCINYLNKTRETLAELNGKLELILGEGADE